MKSLKNIWFLIFIFIVLSNSLSAQQFQIVIKPAVGIFKPEANILTKYYDQDILFSYGADLSLITSFHRLGIYFGLNQFSIKINDENQTDIEESGTLYKFGILKRFEFKHISLDAKIGMTIRDDKLIFPDSDESRIGFDTGFVIEKKIYRRISAFVEANYNYEKIEIPEYVTVVYSRHQKYLSGKSIVVGGYYLTIGMGILLY